MPSTVAANIAGGTYSCHCLNVSIRTAIVQDVPPESIKDPAYTQVFVGDEGITVTHPQITLRSRTRGVAIPGTTRCSRFTTLICLLCATSVYRVFQIVPLDLEGKDGPLLPTEDWVESDIMKSPSGWIEINENCLTGDSIKEAESSPDFSPIFLLVLPTPSCPPKPLDIDTGNSSDKSPRSRSPTEVPSTTGPYLSDLKPLFLPPPYTPSHPAFLYLSSLVQKESESVRLFAEQQIADFIREKAAEVEDKEDQLRKQVEIIWRKCRESRKLYLEKHNSLSSPRAKVFPKEREVRMENNEALSTSYGTPIAVRDFVPTPVSSPIKLPSTQAQRISALSASLSVSSLHTSMATKGRRASTSTEGNESPLSLSSRTLSTQSESLTLVPPATQGNSNVLQFRRNVDDTINTAVSFKYFLDLEEEIARHRLGREASKKESKNDQTQEAGPSQPHVNSSINGEKPEKQISEPQQNMMTSEAGTIAETNPSESRGREKGKRKVTFEVQPAVVTIKREINAENEEEAKAVEDERHRDMIFDLDNLDDNSGGNSPSNAQTLPLIEQPVVQRPNRLGKPRASGLPQSLSSLRPASLPAPSHIRPIRSPPGVDSSSQALVLSLHNPPTTARHDSPRRSNNDGIEDETITPHDAEIMKLVAADAPSHRGAWGRGGKAWQNLTRRESRNIPEETEDDLKDNGDDLAENNSADGYSGGYHNGRGPYQLVPAGIAESLPVVISTRNKQRETLSLASYQPKSALNEETNPALSGLATKSMTSAALRKAAYAERDRSRSMDPGALDFAAEEDENEDDDDDEGDNIPTKETLESGGRGRKHALKILQKRSELPDSSMWRSLA